MATRDEMNSNWKEFLASPACGLFPSTPYD
jgi:hypothetical protein